MRAMPERQARGSMNVRRPSPTSLSGCGYAPIADVWGWPPLITTLKATPAFTSIARGQQARFTPSMVRYVQGGAQVVGVSHARRSWQARQTIEAANQKTRYHARNSRRMSAPRSATSFNGVALRNFPKTTPPARGVRAGGEALAPCGEEENPHVFAAPALRSKQLVCHTWQDYCSPRGRRPQAPPERTADAARGHKVSGIGSRGH